MASPSHYKHQAERYLNKATEIGNYQNEVEFRRQLLSNIRQARIARAMLEVGNYNPSADISTKQGAIANIESSLAGEADFSYSSSVRQQQMTDYTNLAQKYYNKYQKAQKKRAGAFAIGGLVAGAALGVATGGLGFGLTGTALAGAGVSGATIGQGLGQIVSGTGQTQQGIQNIIGGLSQGINMYSAEETKNEQRRMFEELLGRSNQIPTLGYNRYVTAPVINGSARYKEGETYLLPQLNGSTVKAVKGCY